MSFPELPKGFEYNFMYENREVRIKEVTTADKVQEWIIRLQDLTGVIWKVETTFPRSGRVNIYRKHFRCHHNTRRKTDSRYRSKNTNCPAKMRIVVKRDYSDCPKSQLAKADPDAKEWPCIVEFKGDHNHSLTSEEALRYHPLAPNAREKVVDLYRKGHTPASAYKAFCSQVMCQLGPNYISLFADRSVIPTKIDFQNIWVNDFKKRYGLNSKIKTKKKKGEDSAGEEISKDADEVEPLVVEPNCQQIELGRMPDMNDQANQQICSLQAPSPSQLNVSQGITQTNVHSNFKSLVKENDSLQHRYHSPQLAHLVNNEQNDHSVKLGAQDSSEGMQLNSNYHQPQIQQQTGIPEEDVQNGQSPHHSKSPLISPQCGDTDQSILCKLLQQKEACGIQPRQSYSENYANDLEVLDYNLVIDNSCCKAMAHSTLSALCTREQNEVHLGLMAPPIEQSCITHPNRQLISQSGESGIIVVPESISQSLTSANHLVSQQSESLLSSQTLISLPICSLDVDGVLKEFDDVCTKIKDSIKSDPVNVIPAVRRLMNNFNTYVNSPSELIYGLQVAFKPKKKRIAYRQEER